LLFALRRGGKIVAAPIDLGAIRMAATAAAVSRGTLALMRLIWRRQRCTKAGVSLGTVHRRDRGRGNRQSTLSGEETTCTALYRRRQKCTAALPLHIFSPKAQRLPNGENAHSCVFGGTAYCMARSHSGGGECVCGGANSNLNRSRKGLSNAMNISNLALADCFRHKLLRSELRFHGGEQAKSI
jgi:hypothetical protein